MKRKLVVCMDCKYEEKQEFYDREEAEQKRVRLTAPRCKKCGSTNVKTYE